MSDKNNPYGNPFPLMISVVVIDATQLAAVYALLGGASPAAIAASAPNPPQRAVTVPAEATATTGDAALSGVSAVSQEMTSIDSGEIDAHGHPWSADLHASTKGKTKDGLWRMKVGVTRPDPLPGFPVDSGASSAATGTSTETPAPSATSPTATDQASAPTATSTDEEDEFAAFRNAAAASDEADAAAAASVPARTYSDADLGALCNQAAVKLGDPSPIKEIIAQYVPEGQVSHSRNVPEDKRAEFVAAVEAKAGIEFAGFAG